MSIARYYVPDRNPTGASLPGVPLADISEEQYDAFPAWLQLSIDAVGFYRKTKPGVGAVPATPSPATKPDKET